MTLGKFLSVPQFLQLKIVKLSQRVPVIMKANELQDALTQFLARESVQQMLVIIVIIMEVCVGFSGAQKVVCNPAEEVRADF